MSEVFDDEWLERRIREEESKMGQNWDPKARWEFLQKTLTWLDANSPSPRNAKAACLANQQRILAEMARYQAQALTKSAGMS